MAVFLSLFAGAGQQFFTNAGVPLAGGKIFTYGAGGSTPQATYTTSAGNIAHSNPIVLDAAGRVPGGGEIWLTSNLAYKFVLQTAGNVTVQTLDNVSGGVDGASLAASGGSALVGFIQAGSGAVARTAQSKMRETVSVKDFGAVGDGVTDDTAAINSALTALVAGGTLLFPPGTYKVTSAINKTFNNGAVVSIIGYGAKIDGTSVTGSVAGDTTLIKLGGARLSGVALGASVSKYATSITTSPAISASVNDIALITSTDLWNPTRAYYYKGEMIEMRNISGTTISCQSWLFDSYTNTTTTVYALSTPTVNVEGLEIVMNANQLALVLSYCRNPSIRHTKVHGARYTGIEMQYCYGGTIENNEVYDAWYSGTGTSYGVSVATCQNVVVSKNNLTEARHCITGGGWEPCRDIIYSDNICTVHPSEPTALAVDQHGNMEYCSILNNIVNGGITISSINAKIANNIVSEYRSVTQAILVFQEINSNFYDISNNNVITNGTVYGIFYSPSVASLSTNSLIAHGNTVSSGGACIYLQPRNASATGCAINTISVKHNILQAQTSGYAAFVCNVNGAASLTTGLIDSANNIYRADLHDAFFANIASTNLFSSNDKFYANRNNGYLAQFRGTDVTLMNPYFEGNTGGAGNTRSIDYRSTGIVRVVNPVFKNMTYKAELESGGPTLYVEQGWYDATPTILNNSGANLINFYGALGRAITYGTAAPTTGTWAVGDRLYNQNPSVGQPKSWVCTVAGTPGTWVSEGNL